LLHEDRIERAIRPARSRQVPLARDGVELLMRDRADERPDDRRMIGHRARIALEPGRHVLFDDAPQARSVQAARHCRSQLHHLHDLAHAQRERLIDRELSQLPTVGIVRPRKARDDPRAELVFVLGHPVADQSTVRSIRRALRLNSGEAGLKAGAARLMTGAASSTHGD
jgi:hypothetical protein